MTWFHVVFFQPTSFEAWQLLEASQFMPLEARKSTRSLGPGRALWAPVGRQRPGEWIRGSEHMAWAQVPSHQLKWKCQNALSKRLACGCGSKIGTPNGTLASGHMDQNLWPPGGLILTNTHVSWWEA